MFTWHYGCEQIPKVHVPRVNDCNVPIMSLQLIIKVELKVQIKPSSFIWIICIFYDRSKYSPWIFLKITFFRGILYVQKKKDLFFESQISAISVSIRSFKAVPWKLIWNMHWKIIFTQILLILFTFNYKDMVSNSELNVKCWSRKTEIVMY